MNLRNRVQLIGRLGMDPEVRQFNGSKKVARFVLATDDVKRSGDKPTKETQWHNIVIWGGQAEIAEKYLSKGREVAIEGRLVHRNYEDKNGNKKYVTEVVVNDLVLLGHKKD